MAEPPAGSPRLTLVMFLRAIEPVRGVKFAGVISPPSSSSSEGNSASSSRLARLLGRPTTKPRPVWVELNLDGGGYFGILHVTPRVETNQKRTLNSKSSSLLTLRCVGPRVEALEDAGPGLGWDESAGAGRSASVTKVFGPDLRHELDGTVFSNDLFVYTHDPRQAAQFRLALQAVSATATLPHGECRFAPPAVAPERVAAAPQGPAMSETLPTDLLSKITKVCARLCEVDRASKTVMDRVRLLGSNDAALLRRATLPPASSHAADASEENTFSSEEEENEDSQEIPPSGLLSALLTWLTELRAHRPALIVDLAQIESLDRLMKKSEWPFLVLKDVTRVFAHLVNHLQCATLDEIHDVFGHLIVDPKLPDAETWSLRVLKRLCDASKRSALVSSGSANPHVLNRSPVKSSSSPAQEEEDSDKKTDNKNPVEEEERESRASAVSWTAPEELAAAVRELERVIAYYRTRLREEPRAENAPLWRAELLACSQEMKLLAPSALVMGHDVATSLADFQQHELDPDRLGPADAAARPAPEVSLVDGVLTIWSQARREKTETKEHQRDALVMLAGALEDVRRMAETVSETKGPEIADPTRRPTTLALMGLLEENIQLRMELARVKMLGRIEGGEEPEVAQATVAPSQQQNDVGVGEEECEI